MLLAITTTHRPATDLGYLLHKNPNVLNTMDLSFGNAHVFYPEATEERCTAVLLLDVDPVGLVRGSRGPKGESGLLAQYVNDRPYSASSFLSVAITRVYRTAMTGRSKERQELADSAIPLEARIPALPCRGGEQVLRRLFEPLGYEVQASGHPLDSRFPDWGESRFYSVTLRAKRRLQDLLRHLYVLIPVLDAEKHYWVGLDEVEKLVDKGADWLAGHPDRDLIVKRYLRYQKRLTREAFERLLDEDQPEADDEDRTKDREEHGIERPIGMDAQRLQAAVEAVLESSPKSVIDLGCGEGRLLKRLHAVRSVERIAGMDVSLLALDRAAQRLRLDQLPGPQRERIQLFQGSLMYCDARLEGFDVATLIEVVEHLDGARLSAMERVVFRHARPKRVIVTTPNREYNKLWESLPAGTLRHKDHRFEWTRKEFREWSRGVAERYGYSHEIRPVGPEDPGCGPPTQMAILDR